MAVGDPGRSHVLEVIADHQAMRGDLDAALLAITEAAADPGCDADVVEAMRVAYLIQAGHGEDAEPSENFAGVGHSCPRRPSSGWRRPSRSTDG